jgi:hypothetical protein
MGGKTRKSDRTRLKEADLSGRAAEIHGIEDQDGIRTGPRNFFEIVLRDCTGVDCQGPGSTAKALSD